MTVVQNYYAIDFSGHLEIAADPVAAGLVPTRHV